MAIRLRNNTFSTIPTGVSSTDTTLVVTTGDGAKFPSLAAGDYFYLTLVSIDGVIEIVKVTARTGDTMSIVRAQEGTIAAGFAAGSRVELRVTAQTMFDVAAQVVGRVVFKGETVTLNIPSDYADVQAAFDGIASWIIAGTVIIKIANGTYNWTRGQNCNHPFGENIRIIGNQASPSSVIIRGPTGPTFDMFSVSAGNTLGFIDGMTIDLPTKATIANNTTAILAVQGSTLITGTKIIVNNWYYGIAARDGSYIYCPDAQVSNAGDVGIWAFCGSTIVANGAVSNYASDTVNGYGFGFQSEFGSTLVATGAKAMGCYKAGFAALSNSTARIHNCESYLNVGSGFLSWAGGQVEAFGSSSHDNQKYGLEITEYGNIIGISTNTNNTLGAANKFAYLDTSTGSARVASSGGNLRLDAEGTGGVYFHNSQGLQFGIGNSTSPTSFVEVRGGGVDNGNQPQMSAVGAATNISIRYDAKGQGSHFFNNSQGLQFGIGNSTSPTSRLEVRGGGVDTNNQPQVSATGAATDISIRYDAKGQGSHFFNNGQGLQFGIGNSTSPTSRLEVRGGGVDNNNQPQLSAAGTATDVSIRYDAKGQGSHFFNSGSGLQFQIQSGGVNTINQVYVAGSKTGDPAVVGATGLDPLIDLALLPKGVGSFVRVGAGFFSTPDAPVVGYIQIKDNTGVVRKLAVLA